MASKKKISEKVTRDIVGNKMDKVISLCKRRGFVFPGSEIYGGLQNSWDYGPLGAELKNNIKEEWWNRFVRRRTDMVGLDAALIMNPKVWEASGHLKEFSDPMVECKKCHARYRADTDYDGLKLEMHKLAKDDDRPLPDIEFSITGNCPNCGMIANGGTFTSPKSFNLMLKTFLGSSEEGANEVYFRPETAQAMFVQFKNILDTTRRRIPFGIAQMGKAFRNEITPGNFIFRMREFEQMEIEYFVQESEWEKYFEYWLSEMKRWVKDLGVKDENVEFVEIPKDGRAHYSKRTVDIEYRYPFGQKELYGLAYRGDFDLSSHAKASGENFGYTNPEDPKEKFIPHVIEPTWGVDRSVLVAILEAYHEEEAPVAKKAPTIAEGDVGAPNHPEDGIGNGETDKRVVMKFPYWLAPVKVAILPLSKKEELQKIARPVYEYLVKNFVCEYDETQSIGKRYRRQDEIGTPFCVTVDFETINDNAVTVRERDSMKQERVKIEGLFGYLQEKLA